MVSLFRCLSTNLCTSIISSCVSRSNRPGSDLGAFSRSSIAWSHIVWRGSLWDFCSSNTFLCCLYSSGRLVWVVFVCFRWIVMLPIKYRSRLVGRGMFFHHGVKMAHFVLSVWKIMGSWVWLIQPCFQSILGWLVANHGYPNMAFCSPMWVRKKCSLVVLFPVCTWRLV